MKHHRLLTALALAALACTIVAATALGGGGGRLYQFRGDVVSASSAHCSQHHQRDHLALKTLIGRVRTDLRLGARARPRWDGVPHVGSATDLHPGDNVTVNVRTKFGASLAELLAAPSRGRDRGATHTNGGSRCSYIGTVAGGQAGGHVSLHVTSGNGAV